MKNQLFKNLNFSRIVFLLILIFIIFCWIISFLIIKNIQNKNINLNFFEDCFKLNSSIIFKINEIIKNYPKNLNLDIIKFSFLFLNEKNINNFFKYFKYNNKNLIILTLDSFSNEKLNEKLIKNFYYLNNNSFLIYHFLNYYLNLNYDIILLSSNFNLSNNLLFNDYFFDIYYPFNNYNLTNFFIENYLNNNFIRILPKYSNKLIFNQIINSICNYSRPFSFLNNNNFQIFKINEFEYKTSYQNKIFNYIKMIKKKKNKINK